MLKTMSAAVLAISVLAAPALAVDSGKITASTPVIKTTQGKSTEAKSTEAKTTGAKTTEAKSQIRTQANTTQPKPAALNANAKMGKHHHRKHLSQHHRHHGKLGAMKTQSGAQARTSSQAALKTTTAPKVARYDWEDGETRVAVFFGPKGEAGSMVTIEHARLPDADAADAMKAFWRARAADLKALLER